jgi:iron complex transport system permease protein
MNNLNIIIQKKKKKGRAIFLFLLAALIITIFICINLGKAQIQIKDIIHIIMGKITGNDVSLRDIPPATLAILWEIRLPRILTAVLVGSGLAVSGAVFQALLMNPLADSYTMGVSTGAAFGATLAIYFNLFILEYNLSITIFSFLGALITLVIVLNIARVKGYLSSSNLVIAGIIVSSILSAGISFIKSAAGEDVSAIVNWLMGSLSARSWEHVFLALPFILICSVICIYHAEDLNILSLGDKEARSLGIDTDRTRKVLLICGSIITAVCVSVSGVIGFIGLIVPHMLRLAVGSDNKILLPLTFLLGGELLLLADTGARALLNVEVPVGVLTTLLGGPFFIYIFITKNK